MSDNITLDSGSGGATLAADDISDVHYQRVKVSHGADGSATDTSTSDPLPVNLPSVSIFRSLDVDESEEEIKSSGGTLFSLFAINLANGVRYLKFYDAAADNVTVGTTTPVLTFPLPSPGNTNGQFVPVQLPNGITFSNGITIAATTGLADSDTGAPGANEVVVNVGYS